MKIKLFYLLVVFVLMEEVVSQFHNFQRNFGPQSFNNVDRNYGGFNRWVNNNNHHRFPNYQQQQYNNNHYNPSRNNHYGQNGCSSYFSYQRDPFDGIVGQIMIPNPSTPQSMIEVVMTVAAQLPSSYYGEISLFKSEDQVALDISNGLPLFLKVRFPVQNPMPVIQEIYQNNQIYCSVPKSISFGYSTTINLFYTFYTLNPNTPHNRNNFQTPYYQNSNYQPTENYFNQPTTQSRPPPSAPRETVQPTPAVEQNRHNSNTNLDNVCGSPEFLRPSASGLIKGGKNVIRGQFPWLVAYFYNFKSSNEFICGGSLVSSKIVLTAAHCVLFKQEPPSARKKAEDSTFYLGKHNLDSLTGENNFVSSVALELILHPNWDANTESYDGDLAVAVLSKQINFNKFVKPICLWRRTRSINDAISSNGLIAGWGKTESNAISKSTPVYAQIPIVSIETCLRSNPAFATITSSASFCAGVINSNTGPCNGDSGGAFAVQNGNKYYLRGIISSSLLDSSTQNCDSNNYAVFTDVAQFTDWIDRYIRYYG